jgi:hypothetical protein
MHPHEGRITGGPALQIAVAGGSIGGLCAGLALHGSGFDVNVYERHPGPGPHGPAVPLAALLLIGAPRGDRYAAGQDAAPAINPHRCEQNKQCPSGEAEQHPDREERVALLECSATAGMVQTARNRSRECHSNAFFHNLDP